MTLSDDRVVALGVCPCIVSLCFPVGIVLKLLNNCLLMTKRNDHSLLLSTVDYNLSSLWINRIVTTTEDWFLGGSINSSRQHFICHLVYVYFTTEPEKMNGDIKIIVSTSLDREQTEFLASLCRFVCRCTSRRVICVDSYIVHHQATTNRVQRHYLFGAQHDIQFILYLCGGTYSSPGQQIDGLMVG